VHSFIFVKQRFTHSKALHVVIGDNVVRDDVVGPVVVSDGVIGADVAGTEVVGA